MEKEIICTVCPVGCRLKAEYNDDLSRISITGNACKRGERYGKDELTCPKRMVTTTVRLTGVRKTVLSVKTALPVPKEKMSEVLNALAFVTITAPVKRGDIVLKDAAGTGIDVVSTKTVR